MPKKTYTLLILIASIIFSLDVTAQDKLTDALNKHLITLNTLNPDAAFSDLDSLKPCLSGKTVFGIGEATHGTHEFSLFKHRMLEFLVKEMGVKAFVIEDDFASTQIMNDYIINGKGTVINGLRKGFGFGVWKTREMIDMCNWLKEYNATQTTENKVRFFGCDMQLIASSLQLLKDYLQPQGEFTSQMESALSISKKSVNIFLQDSDKTTMQTAADQFAQIKFATGDTALYHHYAREVQQYAEYLENSPKSFPAKQFQWRDQCMAENVEWIYNYTGHQKMMIWAHNAHIGKAGGSMKIITMGERLAAYFGSQYYAMGFDFYKGSARSYNVAEKKFETPQLPESGKGSSGAVFARCRVPNFIIDVKSTSEAEPAAAGFFNKKVLSISVGTSYNAKTGLNYNTNKLAETYDAVIFIKETTPVHDMYQ
jgi:erythromycin esterase